MANLTGKQLRALREARHMTREELAEWLGDCSASTVNKWERDINPVPQLVAEKMLSSVQIRLPLNEIAALVQHCNDHAIDFERFLSDAILAHIRQPTATVYPFPDQEPDNASKVAEDTPVYGSKKNGA